MRTRLNRFWQAALAGMALLIATPLLRADDPPRLKRADSFVGIHMDFHCSVNDHIGEKTTEEMVNKLLDIVDPDFIQVDCKGHPGVSSYPTRVGNPCPNITGDPLKVWRKVTAERGVGLYMHYSGVWDNRAIELHPEWAAVLADGKQSPTATSVFGPYTDELLIPQLIELANDYGVDGVWVDGDCWAATPDYSEEAVKQFKEATGIENAPTDASDPNWSVWLEFQREGFRKHLRHWVDTVKASAPNFQIASNWAFTDHMPEPVCANVDYLSGDYPQGNSVNAARCSARFIQTQGIPWDLMAWSFSSEWKQKPAVQLEREAACVLSQGGGFQAYYTQDRDGSINLDKVTAMTDVTKFCRQRKDYCYKSTAVPQAALIFPKESHYHSVDKNGGLFPWSIGWQRGILAALLENQYSVEIYNDETIASKMKEFPVMVLCQWEELPAEFIEKVRQYVEFGGGLLLIGEAMNDCLRDTFKDVNFTQDAEEETLSYGPYGNGRVVRINHCLSNEYVQNPDPAIRELVARGMKAAYPNPDLIVTGSPYVDVSLRRLTDGELSVHFVNTSGPHATQGIIESIDPVGPLQVAVRTGRKPSSVLLQPGNRPCEFTYEDGFVKTTIDRLDIYDILVIDDRSKNAEWMTDARWGLFAHFLPSSTQPTEQFDVKAVADQIERTGAKYFIITMYQNGWINAPNALYDQIAGYQPGERCSKRDLILDLANELIPRGVRLGVYLTGQVPNGDARAQKAFGLPEGHSDQPIDLEFAKKWAAVFQVWADRYGDKVSAWWIDGCYKWVHFNDEIAAVYAEALHHGNPNAVIAFNPGVCFPEWKTSEFTAGEISKPFDEANITGHWAKGSVSHILTYLGEQWAGTNPRYSDAEWIEWVKKCNAAGGVVTLDMGPNYDSSQAPIGTFTEEMVRQATAIGKGIQE